MDNMLSAIAILEHKPILVYPTDIGTWSKYSEFIDEGQLKDQLNALIGLPVSYVGGKQFTMIYTKFMKKMNDAIRSIADTITIENVDVHLEDEVYTTSKIEGCKTTRLRTSQLHNGEPIDKSNSFSEHMIVNAFRAVDFMNTWGNSINESLLRKCWEILTTECRENISVDGTLFRKGQVYVDHHIPPSTEELPLIMKSWIEFYNSDYLNDMPFIKAAILHGTFEIIHPFCDGNGRLGRLLQNNYLIKAGVESAKAVSFSMEIESNIARYYTALQDAENKYYDLTPFIQQMLEFYYDAYNSAINIRKGE